MLSDANNFGTALLRLQLSVLHEIEVSNVNLLTIGIKTSMFNYGVFLESPAFTVDHQEGNLLFLKRSFLVLLSEFNSHERTESSLASSIFDIDHIFLFSTGLSLALQQTATEHMTDDVGLLIAVFQAIR